VPASGRDADFYETAAGPVVFFVSASYEAATGALASVDVYPHFAATSTRMPASIQAV
jgi:hypothetical protein